MVDGEEADQLPHVLNPSGIFLMRSSSVWLTGRATLQSISYKLVHKEVEEVGQMPHVLKPNGIILIRSSSVWLTGRATCTVIRFV